MENGVELADAAADLFKLVFDLCCMVGRYFNDVWTAPLHIRKLRCELDKLKFLGDIISEGFNKAETQKLRVAFDGEMDELRSILKDLGKRTSPAHERGRKRWIWPLKQAETEDFVKRLDTVMSRLNQVSRTNQEYASHPCCDAY